MTEKPKRHISFSEYRLFEGCEFKHHLSKDLGYKEPKNEILIFGSALHSTIEEIINKKSNRIIYGKLFEKFLIKEGSEQFFNSYFGKKLHNQGIKILKELNFFERFKEWEVFGVEYQLYEPLLETEEESLYFKGIVDLILKKDDEYLVVDWKSAMRPWDIEKKKEDKLFFGQLVLYKHFLSAKFGLDKDKIKTRFVTLVRDTGGVQPYEINLTDEFSELVLEGIKKTILEIGIKRPRVKRKHKPNYEKKDCQYCFFKKMCNDQKDQVIEKYVKPEEVGEINE